MMFRIWVLELGFRVEFMVYNVYGLGFKGLLIPLWAVPNFRLRLIVLEAPLQPIFRLYGWPCASAVGLEPKRRLRNEL